MKIKILCCLLAVFTASSLLHGDDSARPIRLVFWNLEWFPGGNITSTIPEAVRQIALTMPALASLDADVIGMEEILNWDAASIALAKSPGVNVQVASEFLDDAGTKTAQQLVIAGRLPALGGWWELWQANARSGITPKRGFAFAAFRPAPDQVLLVYCVHLKSNRGDLSENIPMREESAQQLLAHIASMEKAYAPLGRVTVVVGGDFNTSEDDPKFRLERTLRLLTQAGFRSAWENVPFKERITLPSQPSNNPNFPPFPDACFDHVFVKGAAVRSAKVVAFDPPPSDHRPVVVEIVLPAVAH